MKFKDSAAEDRFNRFWNGTVVNIHAQITRLINQPSFFFSKNKKELAPQVMTLITRYHDAVKSLLHAIHKVPLDTYEDPDNIASYMRDTINQAILDLNYYFTMELISNAALNKYKEDIVPFKREKTASAIPTLG